MSIVVGEVIAVSGIRISLRIFEDSSQETIFYNGVKYRGVSLREHISIQRGFIDCSGQPIPDTMLSFSSTTAGASPWLN